MARRLVRYLSGPYTPAQGAELGDQFMAGLARQTGWRRVLARIGAALAILLIVAVLAAAATRIL